MRLWLRAAATLAVLSAGLGLAGCTSTSTVEYVNAHARLDSESSQIVLPLERYAMDWQEAQTVNHANAVLVGGCMAKRGLEFPRADEDWSSISVIPDRRYGVWSEVDAENNGFELPQSAQSKKVDLQEELFGDDWWGAFHACFGNKEQLPVMAINSSPNQSIVDRGMNDSFEALLASDEFKTQRSKWKACIEAKGLAVNSQARVLVPQFPPAGEQQLKVAAIDVACKQQLNTVQVLADFETRYQLAYIDSHEGELKAYRDSAKSVLAKARKVITTDGG
jgi:hypothetical protein